MESSHVLIVHTETAIRHVAAEAIGQGWVRASFARTDREGLSLLETERVHVLVTGLDLFGPGDDFVRRAATIQPLLGVVLIGDSSRVSEAASRGSTGPVQYLAKPVTGAALRLAIQRVLNRQTDRREARIARETTAPTPPATPAPCPVTPPVEPVEIVAASKAMREILQLARRCAPARTPILIRGEADTGKELVAREIHRQSRCAGALVRVACGALRETEIAERLFGHRLRAVDRAGAPLATFLEEAAGGTLFLKDVAALPPWAQARLLDAIQKPAGRSANNSGADGEVRVIASTTTDLSAAGSDGTFLPSLYHYLSVVQIHVPPLRHRPQDVRPLAEIYLAAANAMRIRQPGRNPCQLTPEAFQSLLQYDWPGNLLQLASAITHAVLLADEDEIKTLSGSADQGLSGHGADGPGGRKAAKSAKGKNAGDDLNKLMGPQTQPPPKKSASKKSGKSG